MKITVKREQLEFEELKNEYVACYFRPFMSRKSKDTKFLLVSPKSDFYLLARAVMKNYATSYEINYLAELIETYNDKLI